MIVLTQCVGSKRTQPCEAQQLYQSLLFDAQRQYAKCMGDRWYILSAEHGLVHPETVLEPYDTFIDDVDTDTWADEVTTSLPEAETIVFTAGSKYATPIIERLDECVNTREPFSGLGIGERVKEMYKQVDSQQHKTLDEYATG